MNAGLTFAAAFVSCLAGVFLFIKLASGWPRLLDIPNERSSHTKPVVRGAGIAIVFVVLAGYVVAAGPAASLAYVAAAAGIATISFLDDLYSIPLLPRLFVHLLAASLLVYCQGGYSGLKLPIIGSSIDFGAAGPLISVLFIVWTTNAFNFMDGIDGIAGIQGFGAGLGWMLIGLTMDHWAVAGMGAVISGACLGFLWFNWQPASAFMGDVGSTFLGFTLASVPLFTTEAGVFDRSGALLAGVAFLWMFLFDSGFTRLKQLVKLRPFWRAHREHLYQRAATEGTSHRSVAIYFGVFAILIPVAVAFGSSDLFEVTLLAVIGPITLILFARKKRLT